MNHWGYRSSWKVVEEIVSFTLALTSGKHKSLTMLLTIKLNWPWSSLALTVDYETFLVNISGFGHVSVCCYYVAHKCLRPSKHNLCVLYSPDLTVAAVMYTTHKEHQATVTYAATATQHRRVADVTHSASTQVHVTLQVCNNANMSVKTSIIIIQSTGHLHLVITFCFLAFLQRETRNQMHRHEGSTKLANTKNGKSALPLYELNHFTMPPPDDAAERFNTSSYLHSFRYTTASKTDLKVYTLYWLCCA